MGHILRRNMRKILGKNSETMPLIEKRKSATYLYIVHIYTLYIYIYVEYTIYICLLVCTCSGVFIVTRVLLNFGTWANFVDSFYIVTYVAMLLCMYVCVFICLCSEFPCTFLNSSVFKVIYVCVCWYLYLCCFYVYICLYMWWCIGGPLRLELKVYSSCHSKFLSQQHNGAHMHLREYINSPEII